MDKVFFFTGSRAEFGMYLPILKLVSSWPSLSAALVVSGSHVHGHLSNSIEEVRSQVEMQIFEVPFSMQGDTRFSVARSTSKLLEAMIDFLNLHQPSALVVYADRSESFAAALAAYMLGIPVVHLEGGEITQGGTLDDQFRHAITKFSSLHFVSNERSYQVVRQLGEFPESIIHVGGTSSEYFEGRQAPTVEELEQAVSLTLSSPTILATIHPYIGLGGPQLDEVFRAFETILDEGVQIILTYPNTDFGYEEVLQRISVLESSCQGELRLVPNLGSRTYFGLLRTFGTTGSRVGAAVGNSSSIVKDTPGFFCPAVLIGSRQNGRTTGGNLLLAEEDAVEIVSAVHTALFDETYRAKLSETVNPFSGGGGVKKIVQEIVTLLSRERPVPPKGFNLA